MLASLCRPVAKRSGRSRNGLVSKRPKVRNVQMANWQSGETPCYLFSYCLSHCFYAIHTGREVA